MRIRSQCATRALEDMCCWFDGEGEIAIYDGTNTTVERRKWLVDACQNNTRTIRLLFVESICDDEKIVSQNIADVKVNSPDYREMKKEDAVNDFVQVFWIFRISILRISFPYNLLSIKDIMFCLLPDMPVLRIVFCAWIFISYSVFHIR